MNVIQEFRRARVYFLAVALCQACCSRTTCQGKGFLSWHGAAGHLALRLPLGGSPRGRGRGRASPWQLWPSSGGSSDTLSACLHASLFNVSPQSAAEASHCIGSSCTTTILNSLDTLVAVLYIALDLHCHCRLVSSLLASSSRIDNVALLSSPCGRFQPTRLVSKQLQDSSPALQIATRFALF